MPATQNTLRILQKPVVDRELEAFLIDRRARGLSPQSVRYYSQKLDHLRDYLASQGVYSVEGITAPLLRRFLLEFSQTHNAGGVHAVYRAIKAFLRWYEMEMEPDHWKNPMPKVKAPKVGQDPLEPVPLDDLKAMLATCTGKSLSDVRDKAVMLVLLDTGVRASELTALNVGDVTLRTGTVIVRHGKGNKFRTVFLGNKGRRALASYLRRRKDLNDGDPLFATSLGGRLKYSGLRDIIKRRADRAEIEAPSLHSFRRAFALACLRNHVDIYSLQRLMGHSDLSVLRRYLAQTEDDLRQAHERGGPVDNLL